MNPSSNPNAASHNQIQFLPPQLATLCFNPICPNPFFVQNASQMEQHYSSDTVCGTMLGIKSQNRTVDPFHPVDCPCPNCQYTFDNTNKWFQHWTSLGECNNWVRNLAAAYYGWVDLGVPVDDSEDSDIESDTGVYYAYEDDYNYLRMFFCNLLSNISTYTFQY
jgi:hypothetical protein